jgi:hypothetical protein
MKEKKSYFICEIDMYIGKARNDILHIKLLFVI